MSEPFKNDHECRELSNITNKTKKFVSFGVFVAFVLKASGLAEAPFMIIPAAQRSGTRVFPKR